MPVRRCARYHGRATGGARAARRGVLRRAAGAARARARRGRPRDQRAAELAPDRPELRHAARRGDGRRAQVRVAVSHALLMLHAERLLEGPGPVLLRLLLLLPVTDQGFLLMEHSLNQVGLP